MELEQYLTDLITKAVRDALKDSAPAPAKPRGRPAKGETNGVADPATVAATPEVAVAQTAAPVEQTAPAVPPAPAADPFATAPTAPQPTIDEVMIAARELSSATSQQNAVDVLKKATGAASRAELKPEHHAAALAALKAALPAADPFASTTSATTSTTSSPAPTAPAAAAPVSEAPGLEAVKAAIREAQKRTGVDIVQRVIMEHGGKKVDASVPGGFGPSVQALSVPSYAAVIAALNALPKTK